MLKLPNTVAWQRRIHTGLPYKTTDHWSHKYPVPNFHFWFSMNMSFIAPALLTASIGAATPAAPRSKVWVEWSLQAMTKPAGNKNCLPADTGRQKNLHNKRIPVFLTLCLSQRLEYQADCWLGHKPLQRRERSGIAPLIMRLFAPDNYYYFFLVFKSYSLLLHMSTCFFWMYTIFFFILFKYFLIQFNLYKTKLYKSNISISSKLLLYGPLTAISSSG